MVLINVNVTWEKTDQRSDTLEQKSNNMYSQRLLWYLLLMNCFQLFRNNPLKKVIRCKQGVKLEYTNGFANLGAVDGTYPPSGWNLSHIS